MPTRSAAAPAPVKEEEAEKGRRCAQFQGLGRIPARVQNLRRRSRSEAQQALGAELPDLPATARRLNATGLRWEECLDAIEQRKASLLEELTSAEKRYRGYAKGNYICAQVSLWLSLATAGLAALLAWVPALSAQTEKWELGFVSALSGGLTLLSRLVGFQRKANWHYRKVDGLNALRRRLQFEQPLSPSPDDLASISKDLSVLDSTMSKEWADMKPEPSDK
jgi:hypothetical protein